MSVLQIGELAILIHRGGTTIWQYDKSVTGVKTCACTSVSGAQLELRSDFRQNLLCPTVVHRFCLLTLATISVRLDGGSAGVS